MANRTIFASSQPGAYVPPTDTKNAAGGAAYAYTPEQALAQLASTGCLNNTYYTTAESQLTQVLTMASQCEPEFVAACAVYARQRGFMKDMPALLLAHLAARSKGSVGDNSDRGRAASLHLCTAFPLVVDNAKMLRNFVQIVRSGATGRKSLGALPKRLVSEWIQRKAEKAPVALFRDIVGNDPSLSDMIKMVHPKPTSDATRELYGYIIGKKYNAELLPNTVQEYEAFKRYTGDRAMTVIAPPDVPFQMLDALGLSDEEWEQIALRAPWQMTRMNLNTFNRHGVFKKQENVLAIADRLRDPHAIKRARVFPYQLMTAFLNVDGVPQSISLALQDAMEIATANIPAGLANGVVAVDVSGSMRSPLTGLRKGATSKATCVQVAGLVGACLLRQGARVLPFDTDVYVPANNKALNPRDSIMTLANTLAGFGGGGTACQLPLMLLNKEGAKDLDYVLYVSDNESWINSPRATYGGRNMGTEMLQEWEKLKLRNPKAKLICIDLTPNATTQAPTRRDILNVGGFSDDVFKVIRTFIGEAGPDHWVDTIRSFYVEHQSGSDFHGTDEPVAASPEEG